MAQFQFDQSNTSPGQAWSSESQDSKSQFVLGASPRLVGGTSFATKAALDLGQARMLSQSAIHSMDATRKILTNWRRQGHSLANIYLYGITNCAKIIGELWSSDALDFVNVTIAFSRLQRAMHEFSPEFLSEGQAESNGLSLLIMNEPGSQHGLGVFMLSEFFRQAGWRVTLASPQDIEEFKHAFSSDWFDAVVLSLSTDRQIDPVAKAVSQLRVAMVNANLKIYVGGPMANIAPNRLNWPGTTLLFTDAIQTVALVTQALGASAVNANPTSNVQQSHLEFEDVGRVSKM